MEEYPEYPYQDHVELTYSSFGKPEITETSIRVPVRDFEVIAGFPGYDTNIMYHDGILIFEGVLSSKRRLSEYVTPEGRAIKQVHEIEDGDFLIPDGKVYSFGLGGLSYDPPGWLDWEIHMVSLKIEGGKVKRIL